MRFLLLYIPPHTSVLVMIKEGLTLVKKGVWSVLHCRRVFFTLSYNICMYTYIYECTSIINEVSCDGRQKNEIIFGPTVSSR